MQVLKISKRDTVLTLSSGGCNSLNLLLHGAGHVVSVDCNPAQSALLELKAAAIRSVHLHHSPPNAHQCAALCHCILHRLTVICVAWHWRHPMHCCVYWLACAGWCGEGDKHAGIQIASMLTTVLTPASNKRQANHCIACCMPSCSMSAA